MSHIEIIQLLDSYVSLATDIIFFILAYRKLIADLSQRSLSPPYPDCTAPAQSKASRLTPD
ncbi:TPA: hypothetical protein ACKFLM_005447 [Klebsiella oxytoca]